ncbi:ArsR/SmtB family transcription factor [Hirschia maritima]|uniref:ArsR/SmtB family transcription factor n=1 Tax=Hirschia maritima TaxID=1121961 RepID=UPI000360BE7D|nr:metalloregulator ArsR/SmtB family transcription factor [Hirschia maritima]
MERVGYTNEQVNLDAVFSALADPTRRGIIARLASGDAAVGDLAEPFEMSQPAISKHLKVLEKAGLIGRRIDKQRRLSSLKAEPMKEAVNWLEQYKEFWLTSFDQLDVLLEELKTEEVNLASQKKGE